MKYDFNLSLFVFKSKYQSGSQETQLSVSWKFNDKLFRKSEKSFRFFFMKYD